MGCLKQIWNVALDTSNLMGGKWWGDPVRGEGEEDVRGDMFVTVTTKGPVQSSRSVPPLLPRLWNSGSYVWRPPSA